MTDRVVLVTGGAGGIGAACAAWFVDQHDRVIVADIDVERARQVAEGTAARCGLGLDVTDATAVARVLGHVRQTVGPLEVVVNAAGIVGHGPVETTDPDAWRRVLDVNLTGTFLVCQAAIPQLREVGTGKLVNLSSVNAQTGGNQLSGAAYAASKAGIDALTRHLAQELAPHVQVNAVAPGAVATPMLDRLDTAMVTGLASAALAGRLGRPEEVASLVGFLASPAADFITGTTIHQNGGCWMGA